MSEGTTSRADGHTDWDTYYRCPAAAARLTRRYTTSRLLRLLRGHAARGSALTIVELGGANSCFLPAVCGSFPVAAYHIVDNNPLGLALSREMAARDPRIRVWERDVRALEPPVRADVAFSVGLIEHFDPGGTADVVAAHFRAAKPGGLVLISVPTPTWLYRVARRVAEATGAWRFHDERPVARAELLAAVRSHGRLLHAEVLWPLVLTQLMVAVRPSELA